MVLKYLENAKIYINDTDVISPEGFWNCKDIEIKNSSVDCMYFLMNSKNITINNMKMKGKYSYQYVSNMTIKNSNLDTKDAFWHSNNVTVENSIIKGEYLGWYSKNLTLKNCTIIGTQPLCYAKGLKIINCKFKNTDLSFEYSDVEATIIGNIDSIKNPKSGYIKADKIGKIILEDSKYKTNCKITTKKR